MYDGIKFKPQLQFVVVFLCYGTGRVGTQFMQLLIDSLAGLLFGQEVQYVGSSSAT